MKRGLVFSLCALAIAVCTSAQAQNVQLSLNLRYNDPANAAEGGTWHLVAKTDGANGIAGISAYISNINTAGITYGNNGVSSTNYPGTINAGTLGAILDGTAPFAGTFGSAVNIVYGQDNAAGPIVLNVGKGAGTPGNIPNDPLKNVAWNNSALIANGTFGAALPAFVTVGANSTDANVLGGTTVPTAAVDAATTAVVRGDLVRVGTGPGLELGDANRDFTVSGADFAILQNNFGQAPGTKGWDQGDFNNDGNVSGADFAALQNNFGPPHGTPPVSAVPEPSSIALVALAIGGIAAARRRR